MAFVASLCTWNTKGCIGGAYGLEVRLGFLSSGRQLRSAGPDLRGRSPDWNRVVIPVASGAGGAGMGMCRGTPFLHHKSIFHMFLMALQADFILIGWRRGLEADDGSWLGATGLQVFAGWTMAEFACLVTVNIGAVRSDIGFVAGCAQCVVVDHLGAGYLGCRAR